MINFFKIFTCFACLVHLSNSYPSKRIIGGKEAYAGQFPYVAAIYLTTQSGNYFCGGVVLNNLFILTAGQCVNGATIFTILLGTTQLQSSSSITVKVATETYFLHPEYNSDTLENDIGLIRLRERVTFNDYITSIPLAFYPSNGGQTSVAVGWGQLNDEEEGLQNDLNWVTVTVLSNEECRIYYGNQVVDNMLCAIGEYNEGTCIGDSGTPLIEEDMVSIMVIGISSFVSANGCESTYPSGYTRVHPYKDWINNLTRND